MFSHGTGVLALTLVISGPARGQNSNTAAGLASAIQGSLARAAAEAFSTEFGELQGQPQTPSPGQTKSPANPQAPSLGDLGFPATAAQGSAEEQARLDKRTRMLKMHQRMGLITAVPMIATVISGGFAGGRQTSSSSRDLHASLGGLTAGLYFTTAYYSIFAPRIPGTQTRGQIRLHKTLAWIHGPGMVLTPILGIMAFDEKSKGEKVHGIATAHSAVGIVTAGAFGLAIASVSFKF
jgi:hypothetical protein